MPFSDYETLEKAIEKVFDRMSDDPRYTATRAYLEQSSDDVKGFYSLIDDAIRIFVDTNNL